MQEAQLLEQIKQVRIQLSTINLQNKNRKMKNLKNEKSRLIMVSNRLPITLKKNQAGKWSYELSSGGLVTALAGLKKDLPFIWIGWIGQDIPLHEQLIVKKELISKYNYYPIFLDSGLADNYYNGFCNEILWPLFHYSAFPSTSLEAFSTEHSQWISYKKANEAFAKSISEVYASEDLVWIHDYHLMLLPGILRKTHPYAKIGW
jgi:trehalose-6-phosphate synthase